MKKPKFKYDISFTITDKLKLGGRARNRTVVETITGFNLKGLKAALTERLGLILDSSDEPYRPTSKDPYMLGVDKKQIKIYQPAYDMYKSIVDTVTENESGRQETGTFSSQFKPYDMSIVISIH